MPGYSDYIALLPTSKRIATPISKSEVGSGDIFDAPTLEGSDYESNKNAQSFYYKPFYKETTGVNDDFQIYEVFRLDSNVYNYCEVIFILYRTVFIEYTNILKFTCSFNTVDGGGEAGIIQETTIWAGNGGSNLVATNPSLGINTPGMYAVEDPSTQEIIFRGYAVRNTTIRGIYYYI
jgi:hypothetical protein